MRISRLSLAIVLGTMVLLSATEASAQNRLGGHFGAVFPLVTHANGDTTTISDDFVIGFPMGVTVRTSDKYAFDLELVPAIQNDPLHVGLTVHPGVVVALERGWGAGVRMAFDVNEPSWGFTPNLESRPLQGWRRWHALRRARRTDSFSERGPQQYLYVGWCRRAPGRRLLTSLEQFAVQPGVSEPSRLRRRLLLR